MNDKQHEKSATLEILQAIEANSDVTQRRLASNMGVALGLANSYLKRCVRKGLIKIQQAPANRYLYYLTPLGFAEKSRLTAEYLTSSFGFYRDASESCAKALSDCAAEGHSKLGLYGFSDLAEIAVLRALEFELDVACLLDSSAPQRKFLNVLVIRHFDEVPALDAWLFTDLTDSELRLKRLRELVSQDRIFVPSILGLSKTD